MKNLLFAIASLILTAGYAQTSSINEYEYVVVPRKYEFQKSPNQYRINTLVKFLLEKEGFKAFFEGDLPEALVKNPCSALKALVDNRSGLLTTKVVLSLVDCYGNEVYVSSEAKSKIKEFEPSYHEAIRMAFEEVKGLGYVYAPNEVSNVEVGVTDEKANSVVIAPAVAQPEGTAKEEVEEEVAVATAVKEPSEAPVTLLYAQAIENGFQLVDTTPALRFRVKKTSRPNTFTIEGFDGLLYKSNEGNWVAEYYKDGQLVTEVFQIKF